MMAEGIGADLAGPVPAAAERCLRPLLTTHHFARGALVVERGQRVSGAYFVLEGALRVHTLTPGGKEAMLYRITPGETCILALNSLFNGVDYPAWVRAEVDTVVGVVPGPAYRAVFERERAVQDLTVHALSRGLFRLMAELEEVHGCRLDQRLARHLLSDADSEGVLCRTQQDLAARLGTTREVVARIMADFAARKLVRTGRGVIRLIDRARLEAMAGEGGVGKDW